MIEQAMRALLVADAGFSALTSARVFPVSLPQKPTYPAATFQVVSAPRDYTFGGASGLVECRMQFDLYAATHASVADLRDAFVAATSGFRGTVGTPPVVVQAAFISMELEAIEEGLEQAGPRTWRKTLDLEIWFKETV